MSKDFLAHGTLVRKIKSAFKAHAKISDLQKWILPFTEMRIRVMYLDIGDFGGYNSIPSKDKGGIHVGATFPDS